MSNYKYATPEEQKNRMLSLMGVKKTVNESKPQPLGFIEKTEMGKDGNVYAIIRENNKFYLKKSGETKDIKLDNFEYLGGSHRYKNLHEYASYAKAEKMLTEELINVARNVGKKEVLAEEAKRVDMNLAQTVTSRTMREELDRQREIMANAAKIMNENSGITVKKPLNELNVDDDVAAGEEDETLLTDAEELGDIPEGEGEELIDVSLEDEPEEVPTDSEVDAKDIELDQKDIDLDSQLVDQIPELLDAIQSLKDEIKSLSDEGEEEFEPVEDLKGEQAYPGGDGLDELYAGVGDGDYDDDFDSDIYNDIEQYIDPGYTDPADVEEFPDTFNPDRDLDPEDEFEDIHECVDTIAAGVTKSEFDYNEDVKDAKGRNEIPDLDVEDKIDLDKARTDTLDDVNKVKKNGGEVNIKPEGETPSEEITEQEKFEWTTGDGTNAYNEGREFFIVEKNGRIVSTIKECELGMLHGKKPGKKTDAKKAGDPFKDTIKTLTDAIFRECTNKGVFKPKQ